MYADQYFLNYEYFGERFGKLFEFPSQSNGIAVVVNLNCSSEYIRALLKYLVISRYDVPCYQLHANDEISHILYIVKRLENSQTSIVLTLLPPYMLELLLQRFDSPGKTFICTNLLHPVYQYLQETYPHLNIYNILAHNTRNVSTWKENRLIISPISEYYSNITQR